MKFFIDDKEVPGVVSCRCSFVPQYETEAVPVELSTAPQSLTASIRMEMSADDRVVLLLKGFTVLETEWLLALANKIERDGYR